VCGHPHERSRAQWSLDFVTWVHYADAEFG